MPEKLKNATLFLELSLLSALIRHENGAFRKRSSNRIFVFVWTENILKTELFENDDVTIITWFPWPSFPQTEIQNDRCVWSLRADWLIAAGAYPGFCSMKRLGVFLIPLNEMLVHRRSLPRNLLVFPNNSPIPIVTTGSVRQGRRIRDERAYQVNHEATARPLPPR